MPLLFRNVRSSKRKIALQDLNSIVRKQIEITLDKKVKPALVKSHEIIVKDWEHQPEFKATKIIKPNVIGVNVFPAGQHKLIWLYVDKGTKRHPMPAVIGKVMVFQAGGKYNPKTSPNPARFGGPGTVSGGKKTIITSRKAFIHPGFKARKFTATIAKDIEPSFKSEIENAFRRAARQTKD